MTTTDDDARRDAVEAALQGLTFPASRDRLVARAESAGARDAVVTDLRSLQDREFADLPELLEALGTSGSVGLDVGVVEPTGTVGDPEQGLNLNQSAPVRPPATRRD